MEPKNQAEANPSSLFNHPDNKSNFELFYKYLSQPSGGIFVCQVSEGERLKIFRFFDADPLGEHIHIIDMIQPLINPMELQESIILIHEKYAPQKNIFFIYNLEKCIYLSKISDIDFFQELNLIRDFFMRYNSSFVFFMEENTLKQMIRHAVDFYDWIINIFTFLQETGLQFEPFLEIKNHREIKYSKPYKRISYLKKIIETDVNEREKSKNLNELALLYKQIGDNDTALELLLDGLKTIEKSTDLPLISDFYKDIGDIYAEKGDYDPALKFYQDALKLFKQMNDRRNQAYVNFKMGDLASAKQDYQDAKSNYHEALNIYIQLNDIYEQARTHHRLGMVAEGAQDFIEAAHHFREASELKEEFEEQGGQVSSKSSEKITVRKKSDFFITYHHSDEMAARWIAAVLKQAQFSTLSDSWDFVPGEAPIDKIGYMFTVSRNGMALISGKFLQGDLVKSFGKSRNPFSKGFLVAEGIVFMVRIEVCEIEKILGGVEYLDLAGIKEAEAVKRLLSAVGAAAPEKKETELLPVVPLTPDEILTKRKQELDQLLASTIKHNYHMKLDLEQEKEKVVEVENEKTGEMEKRKEWVWEPVPLETVLQDGQNYILVSPSGMGKTTFLTYAACTLLERNAHYPFLSLFFTCIAINNRNSALAIEDFIRRQVESVYTGSQGSLVSREWENLCVLMDALDQARDVDDIVSSLLLHDKPLHYKKAKIILSSRQSTADRIKEGFNKIRLRLPVDDEVQYYLGEESYILLESLIHSSRELVTVPVLLEMLKTITEKGHVVSTLHNRAGLYTEFTKVLLDQERSKPRFWQDKLSIRHFIDFELEQVLEKIAFFSLADNEILEIPKEKLAQYCESPEKKEALLNIGILLELFEDREQKIVFRHQSFQAYFAARYIYNQQPELFRELVGDIAFFYHDVWYEVMRFFVGLEKDPQKAEAIIEQIYKTEDKKVDINQALRLIFAFYLMSETRVSREFIKRIDEQLGILLKNNPHCWIFFNSNKNKFNKGNDEQRKSFFFSFISLSLFTNKDNYILGSAVVAARDICTSKDISLLIKLLSGKEWYVRDATAKALRKKWTMKDTPLLEPQTIDWEADVRIAAAEELEEIGTSKDIPLLEPLLRDKDEYVRRAATKALKKIGTEKDIPLLEPLLRDDDKYVRNHAVEALVNIGKIKDIPLLEPLLKDEDIIEYYTQKNTAAVAIEKIYKRSTPKLRIDRVLPSKKEQNAFPIKIFSGQALHILQISDIHYAIKNDPTITCIFHEFLEDINKWRTQQNHTNIQAICLTGDIAASGQNDQYDAINEKITALLNTTGCPQENLFIIPGNHDVQEYDHISPQGQTLLEQARDNKINLDTAVLSSAEHYRLFHDKFANYYRFIAKYGYLGSLPENHHQIPNLPNPWYNRKLKDYPVRIMGLNSALFCLKDFCQYGNLRMGTHQFQEAYFQGKGNVKGKAGESHEPEVVILLTHHPLNWLAETEYDEYSTLMERYAVLHLHGHIHKTKIVKEQKLFSSSGGYVSIGTGSLYGEKGKEDIDTYHIITLDFENQEVYVWARRWNPEMGKWTVYDDDGNNRFRLPVKR
jgi:tetratricopeptide (TPR) repeat protein/predicted MPP superfamily phosphohydrolase